MPKKKSSSLNCGASYTIPKGYHNGSGIIKANSLSSQTSATAVAADIVSGKTAWVNGRKITGTLLHYVSDNILLHHGNISISFTSASRYFQGTTIFSRKSLSSYSNWNNCYAVIINYSINASSSSYRSMNYFICPGPKADALLEFGQICTGANSILNNAYISSASANYTITGEVDTSNTLTMKIALSRGSSGGSSNVSFTVTLAITGFIL